MYLDKLICPVSGSDLKVVKFKEFKSSDGNIYIDTGCMYSLESMFYYPIINGVPIMLTFETPLTKRFEIKNKNLLKKLPNGLKLPNLKPMQGEKSIQETFTEEWSGLGDDEIVFAYNEEEGFLLHKDVWLQMGEEECKEIDSVLDVGCGFGKEAEYLAKIFENSMVYAFDLNLAVVASGLKLLNTERIIPVVASLYKMPYKDNSFDHVHCQGVIHHTFSTKAGFDSIEKKVKNNGSLFIWVYAWEDSFGINGFRGFLVHTYYFISHRFFRPILSRAPSFIRNPVVHLITILYHPLIRNRGSNRGRWKYQHTLHAVRDMFTPMFAHRHRFNEVFLWFQDSKYKNIVFQSAKKYQELFDRKIIGIGFKGTKDNESQR